MFQEIQIKLSEIEQQYNVRVLYACESGSRAWGFPSTDSDYDVRFIYALPKNQYLSIEKKKDTIDIPVNEVLDINGWDLKKSLRLFSNSNAPLYEWLQSPVVYKHDDNFLEALRTLMTDYYSLRKGIHHYLGITKNACLELQNEEVKIKKYFYCLRSILAAYWIIDQQKLPPMEFAKLRTQITDKSWQEIVNELLLTKTQATEKTMVKSISLLNTFIKKKIEFCEQYVPLTNKEEIDLTPLNILFRNLIS